MNENVILAVTGSIAAFKSAKLASDFVRMGLRVRCIITQGGKRFVSPLTFEAITGNPAGINIWDEQLGSSRMGHLELARWGQLLVVAPASAGAISRLALGLSDDLLGAVALACTAPLLLAPAMESAMFDHPATQDHMRVLRERGATFVGPEDGRLASGATGMGRMTEPEAILEAAVALLGRQSDLRGLKVLVSAGPTYEPIDRVRFIGNRSSGKMGYAVAQEAAERGADVVLVSGPTALVPPAKTRVVPVETAEEMRCAVLANLTGVHVVVMAAAVADFRPESVAVGKVKRSEPMTLSLTPTEDIAAEAARVAPSAIHVGFALEASDLLDSAREKMRRKGQQLVIANAISDEHDPFGADTNRVILVTEAEHTELPVMTKKEVAGRIWDEVLKKIGGLHE